MALLFLTALFGSDLSVGATLAMEGETMPTLPDIGVILAQRTCAMLGRLLLTSAYRDATASILAPVSHVHIAVTTLRGWLAFQQLPVAPGFAGMALTAASGPPAAWRASR